MALRQLAVFMNAGSYVMRPKSSSDALICRRSIALMVPSSIGSSYFFPVRLSTIVSVSAIEVSSDVWSVSVVFARPLCRIYRLGGHAIGAVRPARKVLELASLAAEGSPFGLCRILPAEDAQRR